MIPHDVRNNLPDYNAIHPRLPQSPQPYPDSFVKLTHFEDTDLNLSRCEDISHELQDCKMSLSWPCQQRSGRCGEEKRGNHANSATASFVQHFTTHCEEYSSVCLLLSTQRYNLYSLLYWGFKYADGERWNQFISRSCGQLHRVRSRPPYQVFRIIGLLGRKFIEYEDCCIGYCSANNYYKIKRFIHFHD